MTDYLSNNLKRLRLEKKLTQEQVAAEFGVSDKAVSRWENNTTCPDIYLLPKIAQFYGVLVDDLFKKHNDSYRHYASRLFSVYENTKRTEDFLAAYNEYEKIFAAGAYDAEDYRSFGILHEYMAMNCSKKALEYYDLALKDSDAKEDEAMYYRVKRQKIFFRCNTGDGKNCIDEIETTLKTKDSAEEQECLILALMTTNQDKRAYESYLTSIKKYPDRAAFYALGGDICRKLGKFEEAFSAWEKTLQLDASYVDALYSMAFCYEELGKYKEAYDVWKRIIEGLEAEGLEEEVKWPKEMAKKCLALK